MTAEPATHDLAAQLRELRTPEERAAALGVDYAGLVAADRRLRTGTYVVDGVLALPVILVTAVLAVLTRDDPFAASGLQLPGVLFGMLAGLCIALVPLLATSALFRVRPVKSLSMRSRSAAGNGIMGAVTVLTLAGALALVPADWVFGLVLLFAIGAPLFAMVGVRQLPLLIRKNHPALAEGHALIRQYPASATLLDYQARWLIASFAIATAGAFAVALLLLFSLWLTLPLVAIRVVVAVAAERKWWKAGPLPSLVFSGVEAILLLVAGIVAFAITH